MFIQHIPFLKKHLQAFRTDLLSMILAEGFCLYRCSLVRIVFHGQFPVNASSEEYIRHCNQGQTDYKRDEPDLLVPVKNLQAGEYPAKN
jgi:hypothetical protein